MLYYKKYKHRIQCTQYIRILLAVYVLKFVSFTHLIHIVFFILYKVYYVYDNYNMLTRDVILCFYIFFLLTNQVYQYAIRSD